MANTLVLKKMGCDFFKNDISTRASDVGNYRVRLVYRNKNGDIVHGDFCRMPKTNGIITDLHLYQTPYYIRREDFYPYTKAGILAVVNLDSAIQYDDVLIVEEWPNITKENAKAGQVYGWCAHWQYVTKVWTLTDEEMQENNLHCRIRVECVDFNGNRNGYGL